MLRFRQGGRALLLLFLLLAVVAGLATWRAARRLPPATPEAVYAWFVAHQEPTGLLRSNESLDLCFLYDQALASILFTSRGDLERSRRILHFFEADLEGQVRQGGFAGFADAYRPNGAVGDPSRSGGPMAWLLLAVNRYTATGDARFVPLGRSIADWLLESQAREGGIVGGWDRWREPMSWVSTEHNLDAYAALRDFARLTGDARYAEAAWRVRGWLLWDPWRPDEGRFVNGREDGNYATDVSSWAVGALGAEFAPTLRFAEEAALCRRSYEWTGVEVEGFDFGGSYAESPLPDKDAVWFEGTGQMALAYAIAGEEDRARYFLAEMEKCLTPSAKYPGMFGLPYASNPGTPPYGSWTMPDSPACVSSGAWYLFALWRVNPFTADDELDRANAALAEAARAAGWPDGPRILPALDSFEEARVLALRASYPGRRAFGDSATLGIRPETAAAAVGAASVRLDFVPERPRAWALAERTFGRPEDASAYDRLAAWIHGDGSGHLLSFQLRDADREVWTAPPLRLDFVGWRPVSIDLRRAVDRSPYDEVKDGDGVRNADSTVGWIMTLTAVSDRAATIYLDDVRLLSPGEAGPPEAALAAWTDAERVVLSGAPPPLLVTDFEGDPNPLGGSIGAYGAAGGLGPDGLPRSNYFTPKAADYDRSNVRLGASSYRLAWDDAAGEGWGSGAIGVAPPGDTAGLDLRGRRDLYLWVRGAPGTRLRLALRGTGAIEADPRARFEPYPDGLPSAGWLRLRLPLREIGGAIDLAHVGAVVVDVTPSVARPGAVFLDDVTVE